VSARTRIRPLVFGHHEEDGSDAGGKPMNLVEEVDTGLDRLGQLRTRSASACAGSISSSQK